MKKTRTFLHAQQTEVHLGIDLVGLLVTDGVLAEEIEFDRGRLRRGLWDMDHVPHPQRTAPDGVCQIVVLLTTSTERQLVDEVHRHRQLLGLHNATPTAHTNLSVLREEEPHTLSHDY
jgi:hypothetical protein